MVFVYLFFFSVINKYNLYFFSVINKYNLYRILPSNAHISTLFFHKTVFFSKIFFGKPHSKFLEVCLNSEYMWKWSPVYNFNSKSLKKANFRWCRSYLPFAKLRHTEGFNNVGKCFHSAMPNFDTVLLNKQNWCKSKHDVWAPQYNFSPCKRKA